jgi:hypothetical protein
MMNRLAVVLAADSATTVTYWGDKGKEERYFKGANKIFQLSDHHPVGMMTFDAAEVLKVPWEIVAKEFRTSLGKKVFNSLDEYAAEFFLFLSNSARLFPASVQKDVFLQAARSAAMGRLFGMPIQPASQQDVDAAVAARRAAVDLMPFAPGIDQAAADQTIASWRDDLVQMIEAWRAVFKVTYPSDIESFAELGILEVFKNPQEFLGKTGLVFAGFGDHDIFPAMVAYDSYGIIAAKHIAKETSRGAITHDVPALLSTFAQTSMSDTFSLGLSQDVYTSVMQALRAGLGIFAEQVATASGGQPNNIADLAGLIARATKSISDSILDRAREQHAYPLRRVLGALPVDEMAELAETLINLQSLKEKVTTPSETVGGPVDVAVITKNEGLVWIKRKHFFDQSLNSRFMLRQAAKHN